MGCRFSYHKSRSFPIFFHRRDIHDGNAPAAVTKRAGESRRYRGITQLGAERDSLDRHCSRRQCVCAWKSVVGRAYSSLTHLSFAILMLQSVDLGNILANLDSMPNLNALLPGAAPAHPQYPPPLGAGPQPQPYASHASMHAPPAMHPPVTSAYASYPPPQSGPGGYPPYGASAPQIPPPSHYAPANDAAAKNQVREKREIGTVQIKKSLGDCVECTYRKEISPSLLLLSIFPTPHDPLSPSTYSFLFAATTMAVWTIASAGTRIASAAGATAWSLCRRYLPAAGVRATTTATTGPVFCAAANVVCVKRRASCQQRVQLGTWTAGGRAATAPVAAST